MSLWQWSTIAASNATAGNINWAEGQPPSTVNDSARQMMADVAAWFAAPEWLNYGAVPTYVSGTSFTVPGNLTALFTVGRRVRATVTAGTVYGAISAASYSTPNTTVTVTMDGTSALDSGLQKVDVGMMNPVFSSLGSLGQLTLNSPGNETDTLFINGQNNSNGAGIALLGSGPTTPYKTIRVNAGNFQVISSDYTRTLLSLDDTGNLTILNGIAAASLQTSGGISAYGGNTVLGGNGDISGTVWGSGGAAGWASTYVNAQISAVNTSINNLSNTVSGKAAAGSVCQWNDSAAQFSSGNTYTLPAPYVMVGLTGSGNATLNAIGVIAVRLRNQ